MTTACGCDADEYAQVDVLADEDEPDLSIDPRGEMITVWSSLLAPIGVETGDGRKFASDALSHRELPLPLRWHREDEGGHKKVVVVGTIDDVEYRDDGVYATGVLFDPDPQQMPRLAEDVAEVRLLLEKRAIGPSVDLDDMEYSVEEQLAGEPGGTQARPKVDVTKGRISAATLVQIPAFSETRVVELRQVDPVSYAASRAVLAAAGASYEEIVSVPHWTVEMGLDGADDPDLTDFVFAWSNQIGQAYYPIRRMVDGRPVVVREAVEFALRALDIGHPEAIPADEVATLRQRFTGYLGAEIAETERDEEALVASAGLAPVAPPAEWFVNPELDTPTPLTVTEDGRVFGHLATWRTCHTGFGGCVKAPKSKTKYAYFHTGEVLTREGEPVPVGRVTLGGGHADTKLGFQAALAHYDNAGSCAALVRAGEDKHGIWLAGALAPEVDELKAAALRRHPPSGDWRRIGGNLELIGALAVNTPGFPVPRTMVAGGQPQTLVAAGAFPGADEDLLGGQDGYTAADIRDVFRAELQRDRRATSLARAFAAAEETDETSQRRARMQAAAGVFGMPAFIKAKIEKRKADEPDCDDDDEDCKKKKAKSKLPFGGKKAAPFGSK
jgi:hypothetical protein